MFTYDVIQKFNDTEIHIYKFIVASLDKIPYMTIRELSYYPICDGFPSNTVIIAMSDWNISYNMKQIRVNGGFNATTQVPVLFIFRG